MPSFPRIPSIASGLLAVQEPCPIAVGHFHLTEWAKKPIGAYFPCAALRARCRGTCRPRILSARLRACDCERCARTALSCSPTPWPRAASRTHRPSPDLEPRSIFVAPPVRAALQPHAATPQMQEELIRDLQRSPPRYVIWKSGVWSDSFSDIPNEQRQPIVAKYLREHFHKVWEEESVEIWGPNQTGKKG